MTKNAQISESDFKKPQDWRTSRYLSNLTFLGVISFEIKIFFREGFITKKKKMGKKVNGVNLPGILTEGWMLPRGRF